jgi:hypothetical protein
MNPTRGAEVTLDLGDDAARAVPGGSLVLEAAVADQGRATWSAARPSQQILDLPLQHVISRQPDRVAHSSPFQCLVERRHGERRVRPDHDRPPAPAAPINERQQDLVPALRTVDIARSEFRREAVALRVGDEERVVADGLEVAVVRGLLLGPMNGALGAVDVEDHPSRGRARRGMLNKFLVQASEPSAISRLGEDLRLEPMQCVRERDARVSALSRRQHSKRRVFGQSLGVVRVLVPSQAAIDRLTKQIGDRKLGVASRMGIAEMSFDQRTQAEASV